eukprot:12349836-Alexandrium_andersonii.AAC.1
MPELWLCQSFCCPSMAALNMGSARRAETAWTKCAGTLYLDSTAASASGYTRYLLSSINASRVPCSA